MSYSKERQREYNKQYYIEHKEQICARSRLYDKEQKRIAREAKVNHPTIPKKPKHMTTKEERHIRYLKNRDKILAQQKIYHARNRERRNANTKEAWYRKDPQLRAQQAREYRTNNRKSINKYFNDRYHNDTEY